MLGRHFLMWPLKGNRLGGSLRRLGWLEATVGKAAISSISDRRNNISPLALTKKIHRVRTCDVKCFTAPNMPSRPPRLVFLPLCASSFLSFHRFVCPAKEAFFGLNAT